MYPKNYTVGDILDDMFDGFSGFTQYGSTFSGQIVDTDRYDIVPKKAFIEGEIKRKEEELRRIEEVQKINVKQRQDEIDTLRKILINKL